MGIIQTEDTKVSWKADSLTEDILKHEQLHFDITEFEARAIRKNVGDLQESECAEVGIYKQVIDSVVNVTEKLQEMYDYETLAGNVKERQEEWRIKVDSLLLEFKDYSTDKYKIPQDVFSTLQNK